MNPLHAADWITAFDWTGAAAHTSGEAALSARLLTALPSREALDDLADTAEAAAFGRYIATLRHTHGWNRTQLARQAGIDPLSIPLLEQSALTWQELSPGLVARLARAFDIPVAELAINPLPERRPAAAAHPSFGRWLRDQLGAMAARSSPPVAAQPRYRGVSEGALPPLPEVLSHPLTLPTQELTARDGRILQATLIVAPSSPPQRGIADLVIQLRDSHGEPATGVELELELAGLPFICATPSNATGALRIPDLPLEMLAAVEHLHMRVV